MVRRNSRLIRSIIDGSDAIMLIDKPLIRRHEWLSRVMTIGFLLSDTDYREIVIPESSFFSYAPLSTLIDQWCWSTDEQPAVGQKINNLINETTDGTKKIRPTIFYCDVYRLLVVGLSLIFAPKDESQSENCTVNIFIILFLIWNQGS